MSSFFEECDTYLGSKDLYEVLGLTKTATNTEVKRAYHKLSLKVHPDRVAESEKAEATHKFQILGKIYGVLSDKEKRVLYDETGEIDDEAIAQDRDWQDYWRLLFAKVSVKDIQDFEEKYKGSDEELEDLKAAYKDYEGDMEEILNSVLCATMDDEERFREILDDLVKRKELPKYDAYVKESAAKRKTRKRKANKEADEAEEMKRDLGIGASDSLQALIAAKSSSRAAAADDFFAKLEEKYAQPKSKSKTKSKK